jgi:hypothetical protein
MLLLQLITLARPPEVESILVTLGPHLPALAIDEYGSNVVTALLQSGNVNQKERVLEVLDVVLTAKVIATYERGCCCVYIGKIATTHLYFFLSPYIRNLNSHLHACTPQPQSSLSALLTGHSSFSI